jgi:competence protein ComEC
MANLAVAGEGFGAAPRRFVRPFLALTEAFAAEGDRRILWLPVFFGTGIALYFALTIEPSLWIGRAATIGAAAMVVALWRWPGLRNAGIALAFVAAGFAVMQHARLERGTPMLERRLGPAAITGTVVDIDALDRGWRIILAPDPLPGLAANAQPHRARIHIAPTSDALQPGDRVSLKAMLYPVPEPVLPGGRDMQRELYFAGIGGVGYSFGGARRIASSDARRDDGADQRGIAGLDRRGCLGGDHRQARRDGRGREAGVSPIRPIASPGDRGAPSRPRRRLCVLRGARRPRADPVSGAALSDQE